jgi:NADH:ubiquinone oxidoreductase subunit K
MITLSFLILIFGIIFHRNNFLIICMILELIYLLLGFLLISFNMDLFVILFLGITGAESAIGLSILLSYYLTIRQEDNSNL